MALWAWMLFDQSINSTGIIRVTISVIGLGFITLGDFTSCIALSCTQFQQHKSVMPRRLSENREPTAEKLFRPIFPIIFVE
ncbi:MAG: hypothetical protein ACI9D5_002106 [Candidatus Endobugula sp.]|jgi:hypothetical protein